MKKQCLFLALALGIILSQGCASLSGFHTGRTVGENRGEFTASLNAGNAPDFSESEDEVSDALNIVFFPNIELGGRYGISEKFDVGLRLNTSLNVLLDAKYQIVGDQESPFAMSVGAGFGTFGLISTQAALINFQVPVYTSYHPTEAIGIYLSPRYIGQVGAAFTETTGLLSYYGFNTGAEFGKETIRFGLDYGFYRLDLPGAGSNTNVMQFGIGLKFVFGEGL
jgi:hypothetical protein